MRSTYNVTLPTLLGSKKTSQYPVCSRKKSNQHTNLAGVHKKIQATQNMQKQRTSHQNSMKMQPPVPSSKAT
jgi:hypothetical protein